MSRVALCVFIFFTMCLPAFSAPCKESQRSGCGEQSSEVTFEAVAITAGPYGELWKVGFSGGARITVDVSYMLRPLGELKGSFHVSDQKLSRIRQVAIENKFLSLPKEITPKLVPLHAPDLRLKLRIDGNEHYVSLYSPAELGKTTEALRFLAVWDEVLSALPIKPAWPQ